ncbi:MAG: methyltransferase domain-containing protein [Acidobacteriota bacterium]|nr:methyltransferase domain-containing protein [Acidobacteriota bacterium]
MSRSDKVHQQVSRAYARAVSQPRGSCCGTESDVCSAPKGEAAKVAGYSDTELRALPPEAVENSFGCGNPVALAGLERGDVVLDLGSGAGIDILLAAQRVGEAGRVIGVDMTDEMIERARKAIAASGFGNVEVRKGLIEQLPAEPASVDVVISNCVVNLSPEKTRVFAEISRVLRPGGRVSISDIVVEPLPVHLRWLRRIPAVYNSCVGGAIGEREYLDGLRGAGLEDVEVTERLIYDSGQLVGLALSELPGGWKALVRRLRLEWLVRFLARGLEGRIWSARFVARKAPRVPIEHSSAPALASQVLGG